MEDKRRGVLCDLWNRKLYFSHFAIYILYKIHNSPIPNQNSYYGTIPYRNMGLKIW